METDTSGMVNSGRYIVTIVLFILTGNAGPKKEAARGSIRLYRLNNNKHFPLKSKDFFLTRRHFRSRGKTFALEGSLDSACG
jgi:hypothetical protein